MAAGAGQSAMQQRHHVPLVAFLCHRFFSVLSQGRHISDVSPHGQETSAVVEGTMSGGQARKRVLLPLESPAGLPPVWSSSPGSSLMAVLNSSLAGVDSHHIWLNPVTINHLGWEVTG